MQLFYFAREKIRHKTWALHEYILLTDSGIENKTQIPDYKILDFIDANDEGWVLVNEINLQ